MRQTRSPLPESGRHMTSRSQGLSQRTDPGNEVGGQMVRYHVYVPILSRLSNDIEENPGLININEILIPFVPTFTKVMNLYLDHVQDNNVLPCQSMQFSTMK